MRTLATIELFVFLALVFGVRSFLHWRATGRTGFVAQHQGKTLAERVASAAIALVFAVSPLAPWLGEPLWTGGHVFGALLALLGLGSTLVAQMQMGRSWRIGVDPAERTALVTTGAFRLVRNPIFSAMLLVSVGLALAAPTPLALALSALFWLALELQVRWVEEPYLLQVHGAAYSAWAARTGRFVPGVGRLRPR